MKLTLEDPDQFTAVPATLKIVKVLIEELQAAGGAIRPQLSPAEIEKLEEEVSDDGDWEDDPDVLDLGLGTTKQGLYHSLICIFRERFSLTFHCRTHGICRRDAILDTPAR
jgi:hypothetical protein